ncbi:MAG: hypothetical protein H0W78_19600 [Planctomycetes bacterium]|nr:hypothetical protein [Planctomycetota bacterium]
MVRPPPTGMIACLTVPVLLGMSLLSVGCIAHRTAVNPPLPAAPPPPGEPAAITQLITGATVTNDPQAPITESSHLPIDVPVSVWRRDSDGIISRGELRVTTALPWWQRFPADIVTDLVPIEAEVFASGTATFTQVPNADRAVLFAQAERDGYARREAPPKNPGTKSGSPDAGSKNAAPHKDVQGKPTP